MYTRVSLCLKQIVLQLSSQTNLCSSFLSLYSHHFKRSDTTLQIWTQVKGGGGIFTCKPLTQLNIGSDQGLRQDCNFKVDQHKYTSVLGLCIPSSSLYCNYVSLFLNVCSLSEIHIPCSMQQRKSQLPMMVQQTTYPERCRYMTAVSIRLPQIQQWRRSKEGICTQKMVK